MSRQLRVNPILCEAHGMCAELLPEMIALDEWGYPYLDGRPLPPGLIEHAERAAAACPTFALLLERPRGQQPATSRETARKQPASGPVRRRLPRTPERPPRT